MIFDIWKEGTAEILKDLGLLTTLPFRVTTQKKAWNLDVNGVKSLNLKPVCINN
jgi:hypothetical protein